MKYVGIPNCLTLASTLHENCFQVSGVYLTELTNQNTLTTNFSFVPLKLFSTVSAVSKPGLILCIANFTDECK